MDQDQTDQTPVGETPATDMPVEGAEETAAPAWEAPKAGDDAEATPEVPAAE